MKIEVTFVAAVNKSKLIVSYGMCGKRRVVKIMFNDTANKYNVYTKSPMPGAGWRFILRSHLSATSLEGAIENYQTKYNI